MRYTARMARFRIEHSLPVSAEDFWSKIFFDPDFNKKLYLERLRFKDFQQTVQEQDDGDRKVEMTSQPSVSLPPALHKLVGSDAILYSEKGTFDATTKRYKYRITPSVYSDKISMEGELWAEPSGSGVQRVCEMEVKVSLFGVGRLVESFIEKSSRESHDAAAKYMADYARAQGFATF